MIRACCRTLSVTVLLFTLAGCSYIGGFFSSDPPLAQPEPAPPAEASTDWDCTRGEDELWTCEAAATPALAQAQPAPRPADASGAVPMAVDDYVLQVGAFQERQLAVAEAQRLGRPDLLVLPTERDGREFFVLVLGVYPTREAADQAGEAYLADQPGGSVWVRPASDVKAAIAANPAQ